MTLWAQTRLGFPVACCIALEKLFLFLGVKRIATRFNRSLYCKKQRDLPDRLNQQCVNCVNFSLKNVHRLQIMKPYMHTLLQCVCLQV